MDLPSRTSEGFENRVELLAKERKARAAVGDSAFLTISSRVGVQMKVAFPQKQTQTTKVEDRKRDYTIRDQLSKID